MKAKKYSVSELVKFLENHKEIPPYEEVMKDLKKATKRTLKHYEKLKAKDKSTK